MKKYNAFLSLLLCAAMLASCSGGRETEAPDIAQDTAPSPTDGGAAEDAGETEAPETVPQRVSDSLPEGLDLGGVSTVFFTNPYTPFACNLVEDFTGEMLNDARYNTEITVEERLNADISEILGETSPYDFNAQVRNLIKSGDRNYSFMTNEDYIMMGQIQEGSFYALSDVPYLDMEAPYWLPEATGLYNIGGKIWYAFCPLNLYANQNTAILVMNLDLAENMGMEAQYDAVREGTWTFDRFMSLAEAGYSDLNNNGRDGKDQWGLVVDMPVKNVWCSVLVACGCEQEIITKDEENYLIYGYSEELLDCLALSYDLFHSFALDSDAMPGFFKGHALFAMTKFDMLTTQYREVDFNFGVLPLPKYTEEQSRYYSRTYDACCPVIPITCPDAETAGAVLEALTCEAYNTSLPAYIENGLQNKYVRDEDSSEMVGIILQSQTVLVPEIMLFDQYGNSSFHSKFIEKNEMTAASALQSLKNITQVKIRKLNEKYAKLAGN